MITVSALALLITSQQLPTQAPAWVGKWSGTYQTEGNAIEYPFEIEINDKLEISGNYDFRTVRGNDWQRGAVHGNAKESGEYKILFKYGDQPSWGQIEGKLVYSEETKTFSDETATYTYPTPDKDRRKPKPAKIFLKRPS